MDKKIRTIISTLQLAILAMLPILSACGHKSDEPAPVEPTPDPTPRTVLVYMVATNNLGSRHYDRADIDEMCQAAREGQMGRGRLLVYHAPYQGSIVLKEITPAGIDTLKVYDTADASVSIRRMQEVMTDMKELAPANDYGLVLWSHATGWLQDGINDPNAGRPRSYGSDHGQKMNITALAQALEGQDLSFIYFDCCYMGSVETLYELRHAAKTMAASAMEVPLNGMPYHKNLRFFFADEPDMEGAAQSTYDHYMATFNPQKDCPVSMAVVRSEHLDKLAQATREIYLNAPQPMPDGYVPQKFSTDYKCYYYDLEHYVRALAGEDSPALDQWLHALNLAVSYVASTPTIWNEINVTSFCGLSTYILTSSNSATTKDYDTLEWYTDVASALY